jgi:diacylglycerol kinase family enzyme
VSSVVVIVNRSSGKGAGHDVAALDRALADAELDARIVVVRGSDIVREAEKAAADGLIVAAGGDGTVSAVAGVAVRTGATLGVLPLGTFNHFARDAGIPLDVTEAASIIRPGVTRTVDVGELNGRIFLNNASLGIYPRLVWERRAEQRRGRSKWTALSIAVAKTWWSYRTLTLRLTLDGAPLVRRTPFLFIGNGEYEAEGIDLGARASLETGRLSAYVAPECGRVELLAMPFRALARRMSAEVKFEAFTAREITIEPSRSRVGLALDGEIAVTHPPLRCRILPRALRVLVPDTPSAR